MSEVTKSFFAAAGVIAAVSAVYGGAKVRDRIDGIPSLKTVHSDQTLVASRDNTEVPEADYFYALARLIKQQYVEPVTDDQKLASGAVRGMIASLGDPKSVYMDAPEFKTFLGERQGQYEGIGASMELEMPGSRHENLQAVLQPSENDPELAAEMPHIPKLTVTAVTPGGPAEKAGVRPGDTVFSVDGHWVISGELLDRFRAAEKQFALKKIDVAQLNAVRKEIHEKAIRALLPLRALDRLSEGSNGSVLVDWERDGVHRTTKIDKAISRMPQFSAIANKIVLPFVSGSASSLRAAIAGKSSVTIDLRNNVLGDQGEMRKCLAVVAPSGEYGSFISVHSPRGVPLSVSSGTAAPPHLTLLVDSTTRGAAEIFALALNSHHLAELSGTQMGGDTSSQQIVELPDGGGYTLQTGDYHALGDPSKLTESLKTSKLTAAIKKPEAARNGGER